MGQVVLPDPLPDRRGGSIPAPRSIRRNFSAIVSASRQPAPKHTVCAHTRRRKHYRYDAKPPRRPKPDRLLERRNAAYGMRPQLPRPSTGNHAPAPPAQRLPIRDARPGSRARVQASRRPIDEARSAVHAEPHANRVIREESGTGHDSRDCRKTATNRSLDGVHQPEWLLSRRIGVTICVESMYESSCAWT